MMYEEEIVEVKKAHVYCKDDVGYVLYLVHQDGIVVLRFPKPYFIYTSQVTAHNESMYMIQLFKTRDWLITVDQDAHETRFKADSISVYQTADGDLIVEMMKS